VTFYVFFEWLTTFSRTLVNNCLYTVTDIADRRKAKQLLKSIHVQKYRSITES